MVIHVMLPEVFEVSDVAVSVAAELGSFVGETLFCKLNWS